MTLEGWGRELDTFQKFWWRDWNRLIDDVLAAIETGEAVTYEDDDPNVRDPYAEVRPPELQALLVELDSACGPTGIGRWLMATSRTLGGNRPIEMVATGNYASLRRALVDTFGSTA